MKAKFCGPLGDPSGYAQAARDYVVALSQHLNIENFTVKALNHEYMHEQFHGEPIEIIKQLLDKDIGQYDVLINHCIPERIDTRIESNKFNVGYNTWETDKLPDHWAKKISTYLDLVLVPSEFNKWVYKRSGVTIPIEVVPHCVDVDKITSSANEMDNYIEPFKERFKFLSVFQWTERKHPNGLLKTYFTEFYEQDDVVLFLKTYRSNTSNTEKDAIKEQIKNLKHDMRLDPNKTPKIVFLGDMLTRQQLLSLYNKCDCFVLPTRGEGFGLPFAEAAAAGCLLIGPNQTGQREIFNGLQTAYVTENFSWTPVSGMPWIPNYNGLMNWIEPDLEEFKLRMRCAYKTGVNERTKSQAQGRIAQKYNHSKIGKEMLEAINKYL